MLYARFGDDILCAHADLGALRAAQAALEAIVSARGLRLNHAQGAPAVLERRRSSLAGGAADRRRARGGVPGRRALLQRRHRAVAAQVVGAGRRPARPRAPDRGAAGRCAGCRSGRGLDRRREPELVAAVAAGDRLRAAARRSGQRSPPAGAARLAAGALDRRGGQRAAPACGRCAIFRAAGCARWGCGRWSRRATDDGARARSPPAVGAAAPPARRSGQARLGGLDARSRVAGIGWWRSRRRCWAATFWRFALRRLWVFLFARGWATALHVLELTFLAEIFVARPFVASLALQNATLIVDAFWWGALEGLRRRIRAIGSAHRCAGADHALHDRRVGRRPVRLRRAAGARGGWRWRAGTAPTMLDAYALVCLLRLALDMVLRAFYSGVYAYGRVHRPAWAAPVAPTILVGATVALWPWLAGWSFVASLLASVLVLARAAAGGSRCARIVCRACRCRRWRWRWRLGRRGGGSTGACWGRARSPARPT